MLHLSETEEELTARQVYFGNIFRPALQVKTAPWVGNHPYKLFDHLYTWLWSVLPTELIDIQHATRRAAYNVLNVDIDRCLRWAVGYKLKLHGQDIDLVRDVDENILGLGVLERLDTTWIELSRQALRAIDNTEEV
jgi:hypothetical protein